MVIRGEMVWRLREADSDAVWRLAAISVALSLVALIVSDLLARRQARGLHVV